NRLRRSDAGLCSGCRAQELRPAHFWTPEWGVELPNSGGSTSSLSRPKTLAADPGTKKRAQRRDETLPKETIRSALPSRPGVLCRLCGFRLHLSGDTRRL